MHDTLQKEIALYEKRTPKSAEAHKKAQKRIPLGVASNYRAYDPYPIFVAEGHGSKIKDIDGNEYIDHNLCFGTLMAGHGHPAVVKAVKLMADAAPRLACRMAWNWTWRKKFARGIRSTWCGSATAARKRPCTLAALRGLQRGATKFCALKARTTDCTTRRWSA